VLYKYRKIKKITYRKEDAEIKLIQNKIHSDMYKDKGSLQA
jgi:hypothetical protein